MVMTVSMAGEEQPVFHDFLGIAGQRGHPLKQSELKVLNPSIDSKKDAHNVEVEAEEVAVRTSSTNSGRFEACSPSIVVSEQLSWPQGTGAAQQAGSNSGLYKSEVNNRQGKRRDIVNSRDYIQQQLQRGVETFDSSPILKVSRFERQDDRKNRHTEACRDDILSPMQPPRLSSNCQNPHSSFVVKSGLSTVMSNKWDSSRHVSLNTGMYGPTRAGHLDLQSDKITLNNIRENAVVLPPRSPADEGSRTGLKGSSVGNLLNSSPANPMGGTAHTNLPSGRSKSLSQSAGSESMYVASQQTTSPTSRQLTIFYGGQAHVFDDVPSDKADAIMTLAGSSGRSWSTMYTPRPKASLPVSGSEGSLSMLDKEREKSVSKSSAMNGFSGLAPTVPAEVHNAVTTSAQLRQSNIHRGDKIAPEAKFEDLGFSSKQQGSRGMPLVHAAEVGKELI